MKRICIVWLLLSFCLVSEAQTFNEWFRQKKTQKKYLIEQIAALQVYLGYVRKGYKIAGKGLTAISNIKNGDFNLHRDFFGSLKTVGPAVQQYTKVAEIMALQVSMVRSHNHTIQALKKSGMMTSEELDYVVKVFGRVLEDAGHTLDALLLVLTDGSLEMQDDQRLQRIDDLYAKMQQQYVFTKRFGQEALLLAHGRLREKKDGKDLERLYNIREVAP